METAISYYRRAIAEYELCKSGTVGSLSNADLNDRIDELAAFNSLGTALLSADPVDNKNQAARLVRRASVLTVELCLQDGRPPYQIKGPLYLELMQLRQINDAAEANLGPLKCRVLNKTF